jgi:hypothetical protein
MESVCAACGKEFECLPENITACSCYDILLPDVAKTYIAEHYKGCLCRECLVHIQKQFSPFENET